MDRHILRWHGLSPKNSKENIRKISHITTTDRDNYKIFENIKDGSAIAGKYQSCKLRFKKPNIVIVFSNYGPETDALSEDRWNIFKISKDLNQLEVLTCTLACKFNPPQMQNGNKKEQVNYTYYFPKSP